MIQLEKKFYSLKEIKELMETSRKETITNNLTKWNYHYEWIPRKGVEIIGLPEEGTPEEQLKSLLMRKLGLDSRTDFKAFAAMFIKFSDDDLFLTTPWETRAKILKEEFGIEVSDRTLRSYMHRLIKEDIAVKNDSISEYWYTCSFCGEKTQDAVFTCDDEAVAAMTDWFDKRKEYLEEADVAYSEALGTEGLRNPNRWKIAFQKLWDETHIVYYKVKGFTFNAFKDEDIKNIYKLSALVIADIEIEDEAEIEEHKIDITNYNPLASCTDINGNFKF